MSTMRFWRSAQAVTQRRAAFSTSPRRLDNYAFIGLGQMGYQMAKNLQSKLSPSDKIRLFDVNSSAAEKLDVDIRHRDGGASPEVATELEDAVRNVDVVITCLPQPKHVRGVYQKILSHLATNEDEKPRQRRRLFIDCSTIDPQTSKGVAEIVSQTLEPTGGGDFVDAPMSGGVVGATAGTLTFMLGAPLPLVDRVEPILQKMGKRVLHCGEQGSGLVAKLANNLVLGVQNIVVSEAMLMGIRSGVDPKVLADVINVSTGRCWASEVNNPVPGVVETAPASRGYQGGFGIELMKKDMDLAIAAANDVGIWLPTGELAQKAYAEIAGIPEFAKQDFSVVYEVFRRGAEAESSSQTEDPALNAAMLAGGGIHHGDVGGLGGGDAGGGGGE
ncbi:putative mitochondrial precursor of 3-hydroxyisobutyrate dehydrogenase [Podospora australis]|uniref:3-hydroxyisobutyrate dehydrogenase n=1 Tax=Podospora australis TaxID=1536484 RepID=A0AAN6WU96_9PEZI|nr:putative mitochondrial precursor of 3-hydroxyisobutyrate dehydrogenase [Podospora australis]